MMNLCETRNRPLRLQKLRCSMLWQLANWSEKSALRSSFLPALSFADKIESFLRKNSYIQNADVQQLLDVSPATASRILAALTKEGKLIQIRNGRYWTYKLPDYYKSRN